MPDVINFYSVGDEYGCFSNFAPYPIRLGGEIWPTSEHYFQAQKFEDEGQREAVRKAKSQMTAARMGRDRKNKLRRDWESVKVSVMTEAVRRSSRSTTNSVQPCLALAMPKSSSIRRTTTTGATVATGAERTCWGKSLCESAPN